MSSTTKARARPEAADVAAITEQLRKAYGDRAITTHAVRVQHSHGEGLADAGMPDVVVFRRPTRKWRPSSGSATRRAFR